MHYTSREVYEYISRQTNDPIIERKTCRISGTQFPIYQSDLDFYTKISPTFNGQKFQVPTPTLCPEERQRRRLTFVNNHTLYKRNCDLTGKSFISCYSPDSPYIVYEPSIWRSDQRNGLDYGVEYDFSQSCFSQIDKQLKRIPHLGMYGLNQENAEYNIGYANIKNCYLCRTVDYLEDCLYCYESKYLVSCVDCEGSEHCQNCYACIECNDCQNCDYCNQNVSCHECYDCFACTHCEYCIACDNLSHKQYYYRNSPITKDKFEQLKNQYGYTTHSRSILKSMNTNQCDSSFGNMLSNTKKSIFCFNASNIENTKFCRYIFDGKDCYDLDIFADNSSLLYEATRTGLNEYGISFGFCILSGCHDMLYSMLSAGCHHCFACVGLKNQSYCILNKQYSKEDYEKAVARIIAHMQETGERGEFFHPSLSPFGYNETFAQEYFPISATQISPNPSLYPQVAPRSRGEQGHQINFGNFGYHRSSYSSDPVIPASARIIKRGDYSDQEWIQLRDDETITQAVFLCKTSQRPFRIVKQELDFYRKHSINLPSKHPDIRHEERMKLRPGRTLFLRNCDSCGKEMLSVYQKMQDVKGAMQDGSKDLIPKIYCETCYQKAIYS